MKKVQAQNKEHLKELTQEAFAQNILDLNFIDTSQVTDMSEMFVNTKHDFDVSGWYVGKVTDMTEMFYFCKAFNQDLSQWDVSQVTNMCEMFGRCYTFDQDLSSWDVSQVRNMEYMFHDCTTFDQDLSSWDVGQVDSMFEMFFNCTTFNQDLSSWNVSPSVYMFGMFEGATKFDLTHAPKGFYTQKGIALDIDLDLAIKDLINTFDTNKLELALIFDEDKLADAIDTKNLELALIFANNVDKLSDALTYIEKAIIDGMLLGKFKNDNAVEEFRKRVRTIVQSL